MKIVTAYFLGPLGPASHVVASLGTFPCLLRLRCLELGAGMYFVQEFQQKPGEKFPISSEFDALARYTVTISLTFSPTATSRKRSARCSPERNRAIDSRPHGMGLCLWWRHCMRWLDERSGTCDAASAFRPGITGSESSEYAFVTGKRLERGIKYVRHQLSAAPGER